MSAYQKGVLVQQKYKDACFILDINQCNLISSKWDEIIEERIQCAFNAVDFVLSIGPMQILSVKKNYPYINVRQMIMINGAVNYSKKQGFVVSTEDELSFINNVRLYIAQFN
jgi:hypothetical protein